MEEKKIKPFIYPDYRSWEWTKFSEAEPEYGKAIFLYKVCQHYPRAGTWKSWSEIGSPCFHWSEGGVGECCMNPDKDDFWTYCPPYPERAFKPEKE